MLDPVLWRTSLAGSLALTACGSGFTSGGGSGTGGTTTAATASGTGGATTTSTTSTAASTGAAPSSDPGCADGTREAYKNTLTQPDIAGCDGSFLVPGIGGTTPACGRKAGNDGALPDGKGCNVADLCAAGWHVCSGGGEVAMRAKTASCPIAADPNALVFWLTLARWNPTDGCNLTNPNNVAGCGNVGNNTLAISQNLTNCGPLNAVLSVLGFPPQWDPGKDQGAEAANVFKKTVGGGGVLCCKD